MIAICFHNCKNTRKHEIAAWYHPNRCGACARLRWCGRIFAKCWGAWRWGAEGGRAGGWKAGGAMLGAIGGGTSEKCAKNVQFGKLKFHENPRKMCKKCAIWEARCKKCAKNVQFGSPGAKNVQKMCNFRGQTFPNCTFFAPGLPNCTFFAHFLYLGLHLASHTGSPNCEYFAHFLHIFCT